MKFVISRELTQGNYSVKVLLKEFSEDDQKKAMKFGMPKLNVLHPNGMRIAALINEVSNYQTFNFKNQKDADNYATDLINQINVLKNSWDNLKDTWSKQEEI